MKRRERSMEPELEALLNPRRVERRAPPEVRARALAQARAMVAAGGRTVPPASFLLDSSSAAKSASPRGSGLARIVLPASFAAAAVAAVGAITALRPLPAPDLVAPASAQPTVAVLARAEAQPTPSEAPAPLTAPRPQRSAAVPAELATTELELLARAQTAYTRRDFGRAIALLGESSRRFPTGHLAEEREALRIRALLAAGRMEEGQRAAAAFALRFPRSVLLPKDHKLSGAAR